MFDFNPKSRGDRSRHAVLIQKRRRQCDLQRRADDKTSDKSAGEGTGHLAGEGSLAGVSSALAECGAINCVLNQETTDTGTFDKSKPRTLMFRCTDRPWDGPPLTYTHAEFFGTRHALGVYPQLHGCQGSSRQRAGELRRGWDASIAEEARAAKREQAKTNSNSSGRCKAHFKQSSDRARVPCQSPVL